MPVCESVAGAALETGGYENEHDKFLYCHGDCHLSAAYACHRLSLQQKDQQFRGLLSGRPKNGASRHCHERRGQRHEQLAFDGAARSRLSHRCGGCRVDGHRTWHRHMAQLVFCLPQAAPLLPEYRRDHRTRVFLQALPRPEQYAQRPCGSRDYYLFYSLYRIRVCGMRKAV